MYISENSRFGLAKSPVKSDHVNFTRQGLKRSVTVGFRGLIVAARSSPLA